MGRVQWTCKPCVWEQGKENRKICPSRPFRHGVARRKTDISPVTDHGLKTPDNNAENTSDLFALP
jgi:hypothetical protein